MDLILLENILNLGNIGDKVTVKNGYGRNFLLREGKALRFNKENQEFVNKKKDELSRKNSEIKNKFKEISKLVKDELNKIGTFKVDVNFHSEVKAKITIKIDKIQSK